MKLLVSDFPEIYIYCVSRRPDYESEIGFAISLAVFEIPTLVELAVGTIKRATDTPLFVSNSVLRKTNANGVNVSKNDVGHVSLSIFYMLQISTND